MDIIKKHPKLKRLLEIQSQTRRDEILTNLLETDNLYKELCYKRSEASMILKKFLINPEADKIFEEYSDAVYEQEDYELAAIYKQAFIDAIDALQEQYRF